MTVILKRIITDTCVYLSLSIVAFAMLLTIAQYVSFDEHDGFLAFKQDYLNITIWKIE